MTGPAARRIAAALLGGGLVAAFAGHSRAWAFLCDDAFISFRYAVHLARAGALEYNLGERVEGYTNFLWVLLLAAGDALGAPPEVLAPYLTQAAAAALIIATLLLLRALAGRRRPGDRGDPGDPWGLRDLLPAALLVASPEVMVWSQGGLETAAAAALAIAAMAAWAGERPRSAALLAALAALTRPDTVAPIAAFGLAWAALSLVNFKTCPQGHYRWPPRRRLAAAAAIFVVIVAGHLVFRRLYYGVWIPHTWAVKSHGALLRGTAGIAYLRAWVAGLGLVDLVWLSPLALLLRWRHLPIVAAIAANLAFAWSVGGDFMAYSRFLLVASALTLALVGDALGAALGAAGALLARRWPRLRGLVPLLVTLPVLALALALGLRAQSRWEADRARPQGWLDGRWEGVTAMDRFARERLHVGAWMRAHLPPTTTLTVGAAGALPYTSELPAIDVFGLVDPAIATLPGVKPRRDARARPGHQLVAPLAYLRARDPDLYCHLGYVGPTPPAHAHARQRGRGLGQAMVWACAAPGPVADPHEPDGILDLGVYCCLRPEGRVVGPFGAP